MIYNETSFLLRGAGALARHLQTHFGLEGGVDPPFQILGAYNIYGRRSQKRSLYRTRHLGG